MTSAHDGGALRHLRTLLAEGAFGGLPDAELIGRFLDGSGAEPAFAALVERHGPAVLRVCRSVLADAESAQDAFQATFLVLARKAGSVRIRDSLGPWLVAVAYRTAMGARSAEARRRAVERIAAVAEARAPDDPAEDHPARAVREEVDRLADRYRRPILLCYFAGLTHEGAARQLGCPVGTVRSRLAWGRKQLRDRLVRRGLAPSVALATLATSPARGGVPTTLFLRTARAADRLGSGGSAGAVPASAVAMTERIMRSLLMAKLKGIAAAVLALGVVATGGLVLAQQQGDPRSGAAAKPTAGPVVVPDLEKPGSKDWAYTWLYIGAGPDAPKVRPDVEIEMLLRTAREQERAGNVDQALALTGRMEGALRAWRDELERRRPAAKDVKAEEFQVDVIGGVSIKQDEDKKEVTLSVDGPATLTVDQARRRLTLQDVERAAVPFPDTKLVDPADLGRLAQSEKRADRGGRDAAILTKLEEKVSIHLDHRPLAEALKAIKDAGSGPTFGKPPLFIDVESLQKAEIAYGTNVSLNAENIPLGQALKRLLDQANLAYHVRDGMIVIDAPRPVTPLRR